MCMYCVYDCINREAIGVFDHVTSRKCDDPNCRGTLHDSIINFGENLPTEELDKAFINADKVPNGISIT